MVSARELPQCVIFLVNADQMLGLVTLANKEMDVVKKNCVTEKINLVLSGIFLLGGLLLVPGVSGATRTNALSLPPPQIADGVFVMKALSERKSSRNFAVSPISDEQLSKILWAANGINRPDSEGHTTPSAMGVQSVHVYVVTDKGIFLYEPQSHSIRLQNKGDYRMTTTKGQSFVGKAPLTLVYVADSVAWGNAHRVLPADQQTIFDSVAAGAMAQNVGLVAAAEGLGTCIRASIDHEAFAKAAHLLDSERIIIAQTIGVLP